MTIKENAKGHYSLKNELTRLSEILLQILLLQKTKRMHDAVDPKQKIHSGKYSNANSAMLSVQVTARVVYILSIIVTVMHSDNLIRLLKLPV